MTTRAPLSAGVIARLSKPRPSWPTALTRYAAGIVIGFLLLLAVFPAAQSEPRLAKIPPQPEVRGLQLLVSRFEKDPGFEEIFLRALNETLRQRAATSLVAQPEVIQ